MKTKSTSLGDIIKKEKWCEILASIMPGGVGWWEFASKVKNHNQLICRAECPGLSSCFGGGPDKIICTHLWYQADASFLNLDIIAHVLDDFDFYNQDDLSKRQVKNDVAELRHFVRNKLLEMNEIHEQAKSVEGRIVIRTHRSYERSSSLIRKKKQQHSRANNGRLPCSVCGFDFVERYGSIGKDFAECHHIKPISISTGITTTEIYDLAIVCSNCHRIFHRFISERNTFYTVAQLKKLIIKSKAVNKTK